MARSLVHLLSHNHIHPDAACLVPAGPGGLLTVDVEAALRLNMKRNEARLKEAMARFDLSRVSVNQVCFLARPAAAACQRSLLRSCRGRCLDAAAAAACRNLALLVRSAMSALLLPPTFPPSRAA